LSSELIIREIEHDAKYSHYQMRQVLFSISILINQELVLFARFLEQIKESLTSQCNHRERIVTIKQHKPYLRSLRNVFDGQLDLPGGSNVIMHAFIIKRHIVTFLLHLVLRFNLTTIC